MFQRWTVRGVDSEALRLLREAQRVNWPATQGELVSEAIRCWYDQLPEADDAPERVEPSEKNEGTA
jgi:hypothetical protein